MITENLQNATQTPSVEVNQENNSSPSVINDGFVCIESADASKEIKQGVLYKISGKHFEKVFGESFVLIASNRKERKQIDAKKDSCQDVGMTTPALVVNAETARAAGYELVHPITGEKVKDECLNDKYTIMEGNTRAHACFAAAQEQKPFDYIFLLIVYPSPEMFKAAYRQTNLCNERTKVKDYTNDVLATESSNPVLMSYRDKCNKGLTPKGAAYATLCKEITKRDITCLFNGKNPESLKDKDIINYTDRIFKVVCDTFAPNNKITPLIKGTVFWRWTASKLNGATDKKSREAVTVKIEKVFNLMTACVCNSIRDAKGNGSQTREQIIHDLLNTEYSKY